MEPVSNVDGGKSLLLKLLTEEDKQEFVISSSRFTTGVVSIWDEVDKPLGLFGNIKYF